MKYRLTFKILTIAVFILGCNTHETTVDTSKVTLDVHIGRLEQKLFSLEGDQVNREQLAQLRDEFGAFFDLFTSRIISVGDARDSVTAYYLSHFKDDPQVAEIAEVTLNVFPDLTDLESQFTEALKRYAVLFPGHVIPGIYSYISAFSYTIVVSDSLMGIGLDMYLGSDNDYYVRLGIPSYRMRNMNRHYILSDCLKSWLVTEFELPSSQDDLLSHMIYQGKILYALDVLLPEVPDSVKIGYSAKEMQWVSNNEKDMWFHFADKELFYNNDPKQIQKYIGEGPFTPGFPEGSPGMTGRWIGWQIVRKYMAGRDALAVKELFLQNNAALLLKESKYKPR